MADLKTTIAAPTNDKYKDKAVRFYDKGDHYELIFADEFNYPTSGGEIALGGKPETTLLDIITDLRSADKSRELHIFVGSFGGMVVGLNMLLQQIQEFNYRVGINLGMACSCGFMVLMYCHEIYTSPYAEFMYHAMAGGCCGKVDEMAKRVEFNQKWWQLLLKNSLVNTVLTPEELTLGNTSEVWLTGQELIERKVAKPYADYAKRTVALPDTTSFYVVGEHVYRKENDEFVPYVKSSEAPRTWTDLIAENSGSEPADPKKIVDKKK